MVGRSDTVGRRRTVEICTHTRAELRGVLSVMTLVDMLEVFLWRNAVAALEQHYYVELLQDDVAITQPPHIAR